MINLVRGMNTGKQHRRTIYNGWSRKSKVKGIAHMMIKMNLELQIIKKKMTRAYGCFILKMAL